MQTHQIPNQITANSNLQNQLNCTQDNANTVSYPCHCSKMFLTLDEYHLHVQNEHHDKDYEFQQAKEKNNKMDGEILAQEASQQNQEQNMTFTYQNNKNNQQVNFSVPNFMIEQRAQNQNTILGNQNGINQLKPNIHTQNQQLPHISHPNSVKTSQIPPSHKQLNFRYIQSYYEHKMAPFYREFDIKPFRNQSSTRYKSFYVQQLEKLHKRSPIEPENSVSYVKENQLSDRRKIAEDFDARMAPIISGVIQFTQNFIKEDMKQIGQITPQKLEAVHQLFMEKTFILRQLTIFVQYKQRLINHIEEDFMETDLFTALYNFIWFISPNLRYYEMQIVENITLIVMDTIIDYYYLHQEEMLENLKASDLSFFYSQIQMNAESKKCLSPFHITALIVTQFLTWFNQWCSVRQYIDNKSHVDYIAPLMQQIDEINEIYRKNVINYQSSTKKRRTDYVRKMKKKMIEKKMKIQRKMQDPKNLPKKFRNSGIKMNPSIQFKGNHWELIKTSDNRSGQIRQNTKNFRPFSETSAKHQALRRTDPSTLQTVNKLSNHQDKDERPSTSQRACEKSSYMERNNSNNSNNQNDSDESSSDMIHNYVPKASEYVDYFTVEREEKRKRQEEQWEIKFQHFNQIATNSTIFKPKMIEEVSKQMKEVEELYFQIGIQSRTYKLVKKLVKMTENSVSILPNPDISYPAAQKLSLQQEQPITKFEQKLNPQLSENSNNDAFQIIKNYRFKILHEQRAQQIFKKGDLLMKSQNSLSEESENCPSQKEDDPFDALI